MIAIKPTEQVFVLTGAGISAESGIPTFRGSGGLWEEYRIEDLASPAAWTRNPELVWRFYSWRREVAAACEPNPGHAALAALEQKLGDRLLLCTQSVDDLHEKAGSKRVMHMHGRLFQSRCESERCQTTPFNDRGTYRTLSEIPRCKCGARVRPHICWFGEVPFQLEEIFSALARCHLFISIGTSGVVEPAASFVRQVRGRRGTRTYYVGPEEPANSSLFDECCWGRAGETLPQLLGAHQL